MDKALQKLKELKFVYNQTGEYDVGDELTVKLKLLTSEDETSVHGYATQYEQGIAYLYALKRETLARAIVGLNRVEIPEVIDDESEKVQRHVWLRESIISGWSQLLVDQVWNYYAELLNKVETKLNLTFKKEEKSENDK
jgi:hypothetical protein